MSSHVFHPDPGTYGLADDCPRCAEHAAHPFQSLDTENLNAAGRYQAAYAVFRPYYDNKLGSLTPGLRQSALLLLDRLIGVGQEKEAA